MSILFRYSFFLFLLGVNSNYFSQELDILKSELTSLKGQQKADQYLEIAKLHAEKYGQPDSVLHYSNLASILSGNINYKFGILRSLLQASIGFQQKNDFDTSITILKKLLTEKELGINNLEGDVFYNLGITYYRTDNGKSAIENFIKAIPFYKSKSNNDGLILVYCKLSDVLESDAQHREANDYKNKALELLGKAKRPYTKIVAFNILSSIYFDLRENSNGNLDTSIAFAKEAFKLMKEHGYYMKANQILNSISDAYYVKQDFRTALEYCKESLKYRQFLFPGEIIMSYLKYSDCLSMLNENEKTLVYLDSVKMTLQYINVQYYRLQYFQRYYEYNKKAGKYFQALEGVGQYIALKDSLYNIEKSTVINELMQKHNRVENEKTIGELNQQKEIDKLRIRSLFAFVGIAVLILIIIIFLYRQSVVKNRLKTIEIEQRLNRSRMDPHFFFNALSSLQSLTLKGKTPEAIADYIYKFSKIMRESLESSYVEMNTLEKEIDFLTHYFEIQKLRYVNKFNYFFDVDSEIEKEEMLIPTMILQPFIENSIEHGLADMTSGGIIKVTFSLANKFLKIYISDNGHGLRQKEDQKDYPSRATQIVKDRLILLNQKYKSKASFEISKPNEGNGLEIVINLPIIYRS